MQQHFYIGQYNGSDVGPRVAVAPLEAEQFFLVVYPSVLSLNCIGDINGFIYERQAVFRR